MRIVIISSIEVKFYGVHVRNITDKKLYKMLKILRDCGVIKNIRQYRVGFELVAKEKQRRGSLRFSVAMKFVIS